MEEKEGQVRSPRRLAPQETSDNNEAVFHASQLAGRMKRRPSPPLNSHRTDIVKVNCKVETKLNTDAPSIH